MDLVPLQSKFIPPNFSFVFWKRKFWREKIYFAKEVFPIIILASQKTRIVFDRVDRFKFSKNVNISVNVNEICQLFMIHLRFASTNFLDQIRF
jgi:hypothetical protein